MPVTKDVNKKKNLTTFKITERLSFDDFRELIFDFYKSEPSDYVIFDFREAEGTGERFTHERITQLVDFAESTRRGREKGKTALVANKEVFFGIGRMVENYMDSSKI